MANKRCKDCHQSKPYEQYRKWSNQCNDCYCKYQKQHYDETVRPHTQKTARAARPVTKERQRTKETYAALMLDRLGFIPKDCEYQIGNGPVTRCPLYDLCGQLVRQQEAVFCELSDAELSILTVKPSAPDDTPETWPGELWTDTPMHINLGDNVREYVDKAGFYNGEW